MTDKEMIAKNVDVSGCPFFDEWKHCNLCKEFAKIQNRHLLIEADLRCEEQPSELCYFKQLQSKTAECEELKKQDYKNLKIIYNDFKQIKLLREECARYRKALDEIMKFINRSTCNICEGEDTQACLECNVKTIKDIISKAKEK